MQWGTSPAKGCSVCSEGSRSWQGKQPSDPRKPACPRRESKAAAVPCKGWGTVSLLPSTAGCHEDLARRGKPARFPLCDQYGKGAASLGLQRLNPHAQESGFVQPGPAGKPQTEELTAEKVASEGALEISQQLVLTQVKRGREGGK
ncbi:ankyrin repeat domain-containing protein 24 [Platysternon megacephalum]|uniref:Ankyrin repeat domain-containing protein 24 n=1 Tax=Platysternon megacephalum TaxID=55544 RepID=A0A4D9DYT3_9SAUR|nr:ankyrin repeat domain-containing protein 24 [Platysternon megacephalum]